MFGEDTWLEQRQFSVLHKIVLKLAKTRLLLVDELQISTRDINAVDSEGRTPLSWAAELGSQEAVSALLKFGADFNKIDRDGNTALHYAFKGPSFEVLCLLLDAGSDVAHRNKWGQTPFNWASFFQDDIRFVKELRSRSGVCVNEVDYQGVSAIENAVFGSHEEVLSYLLEEGANPNNAKEGSKPHLDCINLNLHGSLSILPAKSSSCTLAFSYRDPSGEMCLHALARRADLKTASIFLQAVKNNTIDLSGLDTAYVGKEGLTARDLLKLRGNEDVQEVLEHAMAIIDQENASEKISESLDDDPYMDAFELLPQLEKDVGLKGPIVRVMEILS